MLSPRLPSERLGKRCTDCPPLCGCNLRIKVGKARGGRDYLHCLQRLYEFAPYRSHSNAMGMTGMKLRLETRVPGQNSPLLRISCCLCPENTICLLRANAKTTLRCERAISCEAITFKHAYSVRSALLSQGAAWGWYLYLYNAAIMPTTKNFGYDHRGCFLQLTTVDVDPRNMP